MIEKIEHLEPEQVNQHLVSSMVDHLCFMYKLDRSRGIDWVMRVLMWAEIKYGKENLGEQCREIWRWI